jgi:hypothetical protein
MKWKSFISGHGLIEVRYPSSVSIVYGRMTDEVERLYQWSWPN